MNKLDKGYREIKDTAQFKYAIYESNVYQYAVDMLLENNPEIYYYEVFNDEPRE